MIYSEAQSESDEARRKAVASWGIKCESKHHLTAMIELAKHQLAVSADDLDKDPWLFNVENGTIELREGKLREHRRADMITKLAPVTYDPDAECPIFDKFLSETTSRREDVARYIQQFLGMSLSGDISEQIMPVWWGEGNNGKNTLIDIITAVMGDYAGPAAPELLVAKKWSSHPTEIADLYGKRLVVASETEKHQKLRVQFVKATTGDTMLKGRYMHADFFEFRRTHKTILITNNRPDVGEQTHAIWRRLKLIPFLNVVTPDQMDKLLPKKLLTEKSGILAWKVRGFLDWQENGLVEPKDVLDATEAYRAECDHIGQFFVECLSFATEFWTSSSRLNDSFDGWCRDNQAYINHRDLQNRLQQTGCSPKNMGRRGRGWSGVSILTDQIEVPD